MGDSDEIKVIIPANVSTKTVLFGNCYGFTELGITIVGATLAFIIFKIIEFINNIGLQVPYMVHIGIPLFVLVLFVGLGMESGINMLPWWKYIYYFKNFIKSQRQYKYKYGTGNEEKYWRKR